MLNVYRDRKSNPRGFQAADVFPRVPRTQERAQSQQEMIEALKDALGGRGRGET